MSDTIIEDLADRLWRIDDRTAPPRDESTSNEWWIAAHKFIIEILEWNREVFEELHLSRPHVSTFQREITFGAYSLRELKAYMAMLPQPGKWEKDSDGTPQLRATVNGWNLVLARYDLTCELVETGEFTEVEEEEVVEPAKTKKVKRQVPVTVRECPPMMTE